MVSLPRPNWQGQQAVIRLSRWFVPPRECGTTWSRLTAQHIARPWHASLALPCLKLEGQAIAILLRALIEITLDSHHRQRQPSRSKTAIVSASGGILSFCLISLATPAAIGNVARELRLPTHRLLRSSGRGAFDHRADPMSCTPR